MFIKLGQNIEISKIENTDSCVPMVDAAILENFRKFASDLKKIAPKADDFLYFSAIFMHAAEAAGINDDGTPKLTSKGEPVTVGWDKSNGTWKWHSNDPSIRAYKNSNGDIFPEEELIKAHKKWIGKPLCIDHKSSSVDHVRGFIVDTYYDRNLKRVIGLCALDKFSYPDLARKVSTGYSNSVSMGTGVGRAICYDCAKVARAEQDFCEHMRRKSCYGEINVDLNPIELSIVVNGADPKANIKHIIAAANTLNNYVNAKEKEFKKISENNFHATINFNNGDEDLNKHSQIDINAKDLSQFEKEINEAVEKLKEITSSVDFSEKDENNLAFNQSSGSIAMTEGANEPSITELAPPHERFADLKELREITQSIEQKLGQMTKSLDKLAAKNTIHQQEENMSGSNDMNKKAYFQGTEEPTPGKPKYPKDPMNEDLREHDDKQMVGQKPFPGVGSIEGLHPSPESAGGGDELERKKMLARAEAEERAMRRTAIVNLAKESVNKKAYFQGTEEPTPGKAQYPKDKLNEQLRDKEDKQMVGQKPFPGVGSVDGLHPSPDSAEVADEKKRKEMLQRASYTARLVKAANEDGSLNAGKSSWEVFYGGKLLASASVDELTGGRAELLFDVVASEGFGRKLIAKVKTEGADKFMSMIKKAQVAEALPAVTPAPEAAPAAPEGDAGADGDPKKTALDLAEQVRDVSSDLVEAVRGLTGEQAEMGDLGATASEDIQELNGVRKELNNALSEEMSKVISNLSEHNKELSMIASLDIENLNTNKDAVNTLVNDAIEEAKTSVAEGKELLGAFVKYARGTKALVKRAEIEAELQALANEGDDMDAKDKKHDKKKDEEKDENKADDLMNLINETNNDLDSVKDLMNGDDSAKKSLEDLEKREKEQKAPVEPPHAADDDLDLVAKPEELKGLHVEPGTHIEVAAAYDSKEGRNALRAKLAAETVKMNPILHDAHPQGGFTTELDVKPTGDLAKIEDLEEQHDKVLDVATAPVKVRKEAEAIHKLVSEGKLDVADLDALVAEGLDKDAVSYYKKYFGEVDGGSEFASELVKEHVKAELETELNTYKVKLARAYELAYDMVGRGMVHADSKSIANQVDSIMKVNDDGFESLKRVVAQYPMRKEAGKMPQVGVYSGDYESNSRELSLADELAIALNSSNKTRNF